MLPLIMEWMKSITWSPDHIAQFGTPHTHEKHHLMTPPVCCIRHPAFPRADGGADSLETQNSRHQNLYTRPTTRTMWITPAIINEDRWSGQHTTDDGEEYPECLISACLVRMWYITLCWHGLAASTYVRAIFGFSWHRLLLDYCNPQACFAMIVCPIRP